MVVATTTTVDVVTIRYLSENGAEKNESICATNIVFTLLSKKTKPFMMDVMCIECK